MHSFVTIAIPFDEADADRVENELDAIGNPPVDAFKQGLDEAEFVHFMSIIVVHADARESAHLLIEVTADGTVEEAISKLAGAIDESLRRLLTAANVPLNNTPLVTFLQRNHHSVGQGWFSVPGVNFDGTPGMSVNRIRREADLAERVSAILGAPYPKDSALATLKYVRDNLWNDGAQKWAFVAEPAPALSDMPSIWSGVLPIVYSLVLSLLWPFLLIAAIPFAATWFLGSFATALVVGMLVFAIELLIPFGLLVWKERKDVSDDPPPSAWIVEEIMERENFGAQNHLAAVSTMKPGYLRRLTLRVGLWVAGQLASHFSIPGDLGPTRVIHFARWIVLPGTNKLLFMSNFDGTWERYLEDFIELAQQGVTGIWSNTVDFPKSEFLFGKGATDGDRLRRWTRRQQRPSRVWYSAYPELTLVRIRTNAAIRQGIASAVTEQDAADWLACFGSSPRPAVALQYDEIPTLVFGGLRQLQHSRCVFLRLNAEKSKTKAWLATIVNELSYGDGASVEAALFVGFAQSGLAKLGLPARDLSTFPVAYQHGNAAPWRSRAIGDIDANSPQHWLWGGPNTQMDAVLLVYARNPAALTQIANARLAEAQTFGHEVMYQITLAPVPPKGVVVREPFGFVDGISDPVIRGVGQWTLDRHRNHLVNPGEFVLGYPDNLDYLPSTPTIPAGDDPDDILPVAPPPNPDLSHQRPDFSIPPPTGFKDLGCNGTFLVIRQLEQDVAAFNAFLDKTSAALASDPRVPTAQRGNLREWIAAKLVGRWPNGSPLVRYPHQAGPNAGDNDFLFGGEDPNGLRCPFGAHIRRANPRESFAQGVTSSAPQLKLANLLDGSAPEVKTAIPQLNITNRHRILRVGRQYEAQAGLEKPGLIFMCLNSDIERQFEFLQKTWVLAPSFHGLANEVDPMVGDHTHRDSFTIPTETGPLCLKGLSRFVTVRGGGYFFLPSRRAVQWLAHP